MNSGDFTVHLSIAHSLRIDHETAKISRSLAQSGVECILLKGPVIARALYSDGIPRSYLDCDLLIQEEQFAIVRERLRTLGFAEGTLVGDARGRRPIHAEEWVRTDGINVDLHRWVWGAVPDSARVWSIFRPRAQSMVISGETLLVPDQPTLAVLIVLHAAHHGAGMEQPMMDLDRALDLIPTASWAEAAQVASDIEATTAFARGLSLSPKAHQVASEIGVELRRGPSEVLREELPPPFALHFEWMSKQSGMRAKLQSVREALFPSRETLRLRQKDSFIAAYAAHLWRLLVHAPRGYIAWRRAKALAARNRSGFQTKKRKKPPI